MKSCHTLTELHLSAYVLGELESDEAAAVKAHLDDCSACSAIAGQFARLETQLVGLAEPTMDAGTSARLLSQIENTLDAPVEATPDVMTMPEVAEYLRITVEALEAELGTLPVFELAGRLRIRRSRLIDWIETRERDARRRRIVAVVGA